MSKISQLFANLQDPDFPAQQMNSQIARAQNEGFFHLALAKNMRMTQLKQVFASSGIQKLFLSSRLDGFDCKIPGLNIVFLEKEFFQEKDISKRMKIKAQLRGSVVILNNNDLSSPEARAAYSEFYSECDATCFIVWDWDNHHWLDGSTFLAAHSDIYAPAHHENLFLLSRYNWLIAGPVYCSSIQWSRRFLTQNVGEMLIENRSHEPLGMHIPYSQFSFRIQVISTLNKHYPSVGFSSHGFHVRGPESRLKEWCSHTTHWIAPVLNDVPIRIFDALITGGIPIVPISMQLLPPINQIPAEYIAYYSPADIVEPQSIVNYANFLYKRNGFDGVIARHRFALDRHHGDISVQQMLDYAKRVFGIECQVVV